MKEGARCHDQDQHLSSLWHAFLASFLFRPRSEPDFSSGKISPLLSQHLFAPGASWVQQSCRDFWLKGMLQLWNLQLLTVKKASALNASIDSSLVFKAVLLWSVLHSANL